MVRRMKTLLAILLSFIVSEAPVLAIHGGYSLGSNTSAVGTYAGALIPTEDQVLTTGTAASTNFGTNSLGLFTLSQPSTGLGGGTIALFAGNQQMDGAIQTTQSSNDAAGIIGVITATGEVTTASFNNGFFFGGTVTENQVTGNAGGSFDAEVIPGGVNSPTGVNLTGTSMLTITAAETGSTGNTVLEPTDNVTYEVDGFQQSPIATPVTTAGGNAATTTGG
jgi:hypothetical protein